MMRVMVSANEIAKQDDLLIKVEKLQRMLLRNPDKKLAAVSFGVTTVTIATWLKISGLPVEVKKAVSSGAVAASTAAKLHGLPKEEQLTEIRKVLAASKATGKRVPTRNVTGKTEPVKRPTAKKLEKAVASIKAATKTPDAFVSGLTAGIEFALGKNRKEVTKLLKAAEVFEASAEAE